MKGKEMVSVVIPECNAEPAIVDAVKFCFDQKVNVNSITLTTTIDSAVCSE